MGTQSGSSRTTTVNEPPSFIQPYMQYGAGQARELYETGGPEYYPGNTIVPFSPQTETALGLTEQRALQGSPVTQAAQQYATNTLTQDPTSQFGSAMNPYASPAYSGPQGNPYADGGNPFGAGSNPYLDAAFNRAADSVQNRLQSSFAGSGRNIGAARPVAADEMGDLAQRIYGGAYDAERNRQLQYQQQLTGIGASGFESAQDRSMQAALAAQGIGASGYESERDRMAQDLERQRSMQFAVAGLSPQLANQDYIDLQALGGVGSQVEDLSGRIMEDDAARWDYAQNRPQINLDNYLARITGAYPGQNATQTTPTYRNRTAGALGGAMGGAQMGSSFGPWGTAIGAIAGGLLGGYA